VIAQHGQRGRGRPRRSSTPIASALPTGRYRRSAAMDATCPACSSPCPLSSALPPDNDRRSAYGTICA
jgi:hypothetical protein